MADRPLVSIVFSFRNEGEVIPTLLERLGHVLQPLPIEYELIFVNDASTDDSLALLTEAAGHDTRIKVVNMSRRFGVEDCIRAGMKYAAGDAVITMDADLQDPPEVLPELIDKWQQGADVAYTVRASRVGESNLKLWLTKFAYKIIRAVADIDLPVEAGIFRLMSRRVVNELSRLGECDPYLRGLVTWVGYKQVPVHYHRQERAAGSSHFPLYTKGPVSTFVAGITSFSLVPLTVFLLIGLLICLAAVTSGIALIVLKLLQVSVSPWSVLIIVVAFLSGIQLLGIGVLGLYVGRVYNEVKNRPHYIVESTIGFAPDPEHIGARPIAAK